MNGLINCLERSLGLIFYLLLLMMMLLLLLLANNNIVSLPSYQPPLMIRNIKKTIVAKNMKFRSLKQLKHLLVNTGTSWASVRLYYKSSLVSMGNGLVSLACPF